MGSGAAPSACLSPPCTLSKNSFEAVLLIPILSAQEDSRDEGWWGDSLNFPLSRGQPFLRGGQEILTNYSVVIYVITEVCTRYRDSVMEWDYQKKLTKEGIYKLNQTMQRAWSGRITEGTASAEQGVLEEFHPTAMVQGGLLQEIQISKERRQGLGGEWPHGPC